jgi:hypothetical protein
MSLPESRYCPRCKTTKAASDYRIAKGGGHFAGYCTPCAREYNAEKIAREPDKYRRLKRESARRTRADVLAAYGGRCECCGETQSEFLSIDHIDGGGAEHRASIRRTTMYAWLRQQGYPRDNFQLLCMNCNFAKGKYGNCPHEVARYDLPYAVNVPQEVF